MAETARAKGVRVRGYVSCVLGCPYEGRVSSDRVFAIAERLVAAGCEEVAFGDTTGMANPAQVRDFFAAAAEAMRRILVEAARRKRRGKHGGDRSRLGLHDAQPAAADARDDLVALDAALTLLASVDPQAAKLV